MTIWHLWSTNLYKYSHESRKSLGLIIAKVTAEPWLELVSNHV